MRQLQQSERVAASLGDDPVADLLIDQPREPGGQQRTGVVGIQPVEHELRQAAEYLAALARHEHDRDRLREQPAGDERQREGGFLVEPLRIVDRTQKRLLLGRIREQAERRQADDEAIRRLAVAEPERHTQSLALGRGQSVEPTEHRRAELVQAGKRELDLRLNSDRPQQPQVRRRIDRVVQQRGLADARLSAHHEGAALPRARRAKQPAESGALRVAATQGYSPSHRRKRNLHRRGRRARAGRNGADH